MNRLLQIIALIVAAAAVVSAMSAELAGNPLLQPQTLRWRSSVVRIAVSTSITAQNSNIKADADVMAALERSIAAWEAVSGLEFRIESSDRQNVSPSGTAGDGVNLVTIAPTQENLQLFASDPFGESAKTRVFYNRRGTITEADIVLNPLQQFSTDGTYGTFDLETTLSHEIGHLIGLKHSPISGSIMAEHIPRNGDVYFGPRLPIEGDVAAVRDLYGIDSDICCGVVMGRLTASGKTKGVTIWAEDTQGRVVAQTEANADGSYRLGGLSDAKYQIFWQRRDPSGTSTGDLGSVTIENGAIATLSKRINADLADIVVEDVGLGLHPGDSAILVRPGRQYTICLAGHGLADAVTSVTFSSKSIHSEIASLSRQDLGRKADAVSLSISLDPDTPPGVYTLYATRRDGTRAAAVGAVLVSK
jgi:hypothetical protein